METELIYSVEEIFSGFNKDFLIPDYQRGYKWTSNNVRKLLEDIDAFIPSDKDSFYCVQNITLNEKEDSYNVVDGQQRLTTLYLILCYLKDITEINNFRDKLKYEIRTSTQKFILEDIASKKCWKEGYSHTEAHMDEFYIKEATRTIKEYFDPSQTSGNQIDKDSFKEKFLHQTKLIVNVLSCSNEEKTFANLNGVKVPLDGADLVRAMLITRSLGSYNTERNNTELTKQYRVRMGMELDEISLWWSNGDVKKFFERMLPSNFIKIAKDQKFDISSYPIDLLYVLFYFSQKFDLKSFSLDSFETLLQEEVNLEGCNDSFRKILSFHQEMRDWFENKETYHYLGYIFTNLRTKSESDKTNRFCQLYQDWASARSKKTFVNMLIHMIQEDLCSLFVDDNKISGKTGRDKLLNAISFEEKYDWYHCPYLPNILILEDVLSCIRSSNLMLKVDYFKVTNEDREHIGCQTPNEEQMTDKNFWLKSFDTMLTVIDERDKSLLLNLKQKIQDSLEITEEIKQSINENLTLFGLNSIGNMALLDGSVNRGYGNDPYNEKAKAILNNYFNVVDISSRKRSSKNKYIRPHTLKVFIQDKEEKWGTKEIINCSVEIRKSMEEFLNL